MGYCCKKLQQTKTVTLTFKRSELLYDVENYSFVEGDIMETENEHARHQVFDIGQSGNVNRVTRVLNLTHAECVEMLYPYTRISYCTHFTGRFFFIYGEATKTSDTRVSYL